MIKEEIHNSSKRMILPIALLYLLFWAFCLWMAYQIPYTHDDWDWGLPVGIEQLLTANINSRYAGNLLVVLLTRSPFLKTFVMGSTLFLLPVVCVRLATGAWTLFGRPAICAALFCCASVTLLIANYICWSETIGWVSGFCNFVFSALLLGLFFVFSAGVFEGGRVRRIGVLKALGMFLFCIALQLFLENVAFYMVCVSLAFFIIDWLKNRMPSLRFGALLGGSLTGAAIMFSSSIYDALFSTGVSVGNYRKLSFDLSAGPFSTVKAMALRFITQIAPGIWETNVILMLLIFAVGLWLLIKKARTLSRPVLFTLAIFDLLFFAVFALFLLDWEPALKYNHGNLYHLLINGGCFFFVALLVLLLYRGQPHKQFKLLGFWVSAPLVLLPIAAIELVGNRLYFTSNFFLIVFLLSLLNDCLTDSKPLLQICFALSGAVILAFVCSYWAVVYSAIGSVYAQQLSLIAQLRQSGSNQLSLPRFPYEEYLHCPYPGDEQRLDFYKAFFGIAREVTIQFIK